MCYYTSWSNYRTGEGKLTPSDVDPFQCTHLIFAFASINYDNELIPGDQRDIESYKTFNGLKDRSVLNSLNILEVVLYFEVLNNYNFNSLSYRNPDLKTLLAVGGQTFCKSQYVVRYVNTTKPKTISFNMRRESFSAFCLNFQIQEHGINKSQER